MSAEATGFGHPATPQEEAALLAFMAQYEPVTMAAQLGREPRSPYTCPCGRSVAKPRALCIRCGNTSEIGSAWDLGSEAGHAQPDSVPEIGRRRS